MSDEGADAPSQIMTVAEVSGLLQVHPSTLYRLIRNGKFPHFKIGSDYRFNREQVYEWMADQQVPQLRSK